MYKRNKYNYEFRLQCVEAVLKENRSVKSVAKEKGFDESNLRLWVGFYRQYGPSGLQPKGKRFYSADFKLQVLTTMDKELLSLRSACARFNVGSESVIISWQKAYNLKGPLGLIPQPTGRPKKMTPIKRKPRKTAKTLTREEELLLENERLRAENELLKKLHALVQSNKKQKP